MVYSQTYSNSLILIGFPRSVVQFSHSVMSDFYNPMNYSTPRFPVHHKVPKLTQTHIHWICNANQPSHPLSSLSPLAFNLSQHQGLFQWVRSSHQVAKVLELQLQPSVLPMNIQDWFPLGLTGLISLQSKGLSRVFSNTIVQKHQFFSVSFLYGPTLTSMHDYWKNHSFDYTDLCQPSNVSAF